MGEEIKATGFTPADKARFASRLAQETGLARTLYERDKFSRDGHMVGFEVETWIVDHNYAPSSINQTLLETLNHPLVVPELSRFNLELNCAPVRLAGDALTQAHQSLTRLWATCNDVAHRLDANLVLIGTLPTIRDSDLTLANMSPLNRYYALNQEVLRLRGGQPLHVNIAGRDRLASVHTDVMLEAATTSFQIHLKAPADLAHRYYNASVAASGPILAACGNAPFLFGKALWEETRVPLFEQAVKVPGPARVSMGSGYVTRSLIEIFEENLRDYDALLPMAFDDPPEEMRHLRLHNGVIWRWNRPLIGFDESGAPHFRVEHRILPAGPTFIDMMANVALYLGLARTLAMAGDGAAATEREGWRSTTPNATSIPRRVLASMRGSTGRGRAKSQRIDCCSSVSFPRPGQGFATWKSTKTASSISSKRGCEPARRARPGSEKRLRRATAIFMA